MEILGIGASELVFVVIIALIVLGPKDMQKAGKTIGKWLRDIVTSDGWRAFQKTSNELKNLPARMMRDANVDLEKFNRDLKTGMEFKKPYDKPPRSMQADSKPTPDLDQSGKPEDTAQPPSPTEPNDNDEIAQHHD